MVTNSGNQFFGENRLLDSFLSYERFHELRHL